MLNVFIVPSSAIVRPGCVLAYIETGQYYMISKAYRVELGTLPLPLYILGDKKVWCVSQL